MIGSNTKLILSNMNTLFITKDENIVKLGKILSNENRLRILQLSDGRHIRKDIEYALDLTPNAFTNHINVINSLPREKRILNKLREGNTVSYVRNYDYILIAL